MLITLVDANYMFIYVDIGCQGRISDGGVFKNTSLWVTLEKNQLILPLDAQLSNQNEIVPYVFVGDNAFALGTHMMKPYSGSF